MQILWCRAGIDDCGEYVIMCGLSVTSSSYLFERSSSSTALVTA